MDDLLLDTPSIPPTSNQGPLPPHLDLQLIEAFCEQWLPATETTSTYFFTKSSLRDYLGAQRDTLVQTLDPLNEYIDYLKARGYQWISDIELRQPILLVRENILDI